LEIEDLDMKSLVELDGVTHINVYSHGKTELGRLLSNFAHTPFHHPTFGWFESMEGYWYWLGTGMQHDDLRRYWGYEAKRIGKMYERATFPNFEELIEEGLYYKLLWHPEIQELIVNSTLPFYHYYTYGGGAKIIMPSNTEWLLDCLEELRFNLKHTTSLSGEA